MAAEHLIDGGAHPGEIAIPLAQEVELGAVRMADIPARVQPLVRLARVELSKGRDYEIEHRRNLAGTDDGTAR